MLGRVPLQVQSSNTRAGSNSKMKVFWNPDCLLHAPPYEFLSGDKLPYFESPLRLQSIKKALEEHPSFFTFESINSSESESSQSPTLDILRYVQMVHSPEYLRYLGNAYDNWVRSGGSTVLL
jgi:acetoin utilization deacetylase AcuC-like enzyme